MQYKKIKNTSIYYTHTHRNIIHPFKKKGISVLCDNIHKPGGYYVKQDKNIQMLHIITDM